MKLGRGRTEHRLLQCDWRVQLSEKKEARSLLWVSPGVRLAPPLGFGFPHAGCRQLYAALFHILSGFNFPFEILDRNETSFLTRK